MKAGEAVTLRGRVRVAVGEKSWVEYDAPKGQGLLVLLLGIENLKKPFSRDDIIEMLNELGLVHGDQLLPEELSALRKRLDEKVAAEKSKKEEAVAPTPKLKRTKAPASRKPSKKAKAS